MLCKQLVIACMVAWTLSESFLPGGVSSREGEAVERSRDRLTAIGAVVSDNQSVS